MDNTDFPWSLDTETLQTAYNTDITLGLDAAAAEKRLSESGVNTIKESRKLTFWSILFAELKDPLIIVTLIIGVIYSIWGQIGDTLTIICLIFVVTLVEVYTEFKAKKSIEALRKLASPTTWVIRNGKPDEIDAGSVVPGDLLILKSGAKVSADARVITARGLEVDESQLTGESMGIEKTPGPVPESTGLSDRTCMLHMGSVILKGKGTAVVVRTGMDTELGRIAGMTRDAGDPKTPMQKSILQMTRNLIGIAVIFSVLIPILGFIRGMPVPEMILTGLSLALATVPEELPIIMTMLLGFGAIQLSKRNVLIRRTKASETLGSVTVIATDKTGTLTENKMSIEKWTAGNEQQLFTIGALMADVSIDSEGNFLGDPMDKAVVERARGLHIERSELQKEYTLMHDYGFDNTRKIFRMTYDHQGVALQVIKGAPESIFSMSEIDAEMDNELNASFAAGYRTIAVGFLSPPDEKYTIAGLICFNDPIREEVKPAIRDFSAAGVRVIMITGDHASTAARVAAEAGISADVVITGKEISAMSDEELGNAVERCSVFARITPEDKLRIVTSLQEKGEVVAMTGDGINDAPALKAADIGISLGIAGTDVAKEASDMVLANDDFTALIDAIKEGRRLYENMSKCVTYALASKIGLVITFLIPILLDVPLPFAPIQIIVMELFMDLSASTAFVVEPAESDLLKRKPRDPKEKFMNKRMIAGIFSGSATLTIVVLLVYFVSWFQTGDLGIARTFAFVAWLFCHIALALNMRTSRVPLSRAGFFSSKAMNVWMAGVVVFLVLVLNVPFLWEYLRLSPVGLLPVAGVALLAFAAVSWIEIRKHAAGKGVEGR
jgi:Ca2+-transporting ATPase